MTVLREWRAAGCDLPVLILTARDGWSEKVAGFLVIEDDGPGLIEDARKESLTPGRRLDERGDGHGFGLPIAQELAELNGGELTLGSAQPGGLRVVLVLPARANT